MPYFSSYAVIGEVNMLTSRCDLSSHIPIQLKKKKKGSQPFILYIFLNVCQGVFVTEGVCKLDICQQPFVGGDAFLGKVAHVTAYPGKTLTLAQKA